MWINTRNRLVLEEEEHLRELGKNDQYRFMNSPTISYPGVPSSRSSTAILLTFFLFWLGGNKISHNPFIGSEKAKPARTNSKLEEMILSHAVSIDGFSDVLSTLQGGNHHRENNMPDAKKAESFSENRFALLAADDAVESDQVENTELSEKLDGRDNSRERQNEEEETCEQTGHNLDRSLPARLWAVKPPPMPRHC
ncbi:hypothetical protein N7450_001748 [Penicillium hetheringtonii]|uniref:Uncharacterized protein n=1 Tax=Penicillium hetheringtonii TaxID=911720 RepID=A0AAD6E4Q7_9EURO|nr:hypothetical protein N7450_001748 [Penicillium hetheringtonii]